MAKNNFLNLIITRKIKYNNSFYENFYQKNLKNKFFFSLSCGKKIFFRFSRRIFFYLDRAFDQAAKGKKEKKFLSASPESSWRPPTFKKIKRKGRVKLTFVFKDN